MGNSDDDSSRGSDGSVSDAPSDESYEEEGVEVEQKFDEHPPPASPMQRSPTRVYAVDKPDEELAQFPPEGPYEEGSHMRITNIIEQENDDGGEKESCFGRIWRDHRIPVIIICISILLIALCVTLGIVISGVRDSGSGRAAQGVSSTMAPTATPVLELPEYTLKAIEEDPESPQARAFNWHIVNAFNNSYSTERMLQRFCLATLYYATRGDEWINNTEWLSESHECNWFSSTHREDYPDPVSPCATNSDKISQLILSNNNLTTYKGLPDELYLLTDLIHLDLQSNSITGKISPFVGNLTDLQRLRLNRNQLTGSLPVQMGELSRLGVLSLYNNQFSGSLTNQNLPASVTQLWLSSNNLDGSLPNFASFQELQILWLDQNMFTGTLPSELGLLDALLSLDLGSNALTGTIPAFGASLSNLETLVFHQNLLFGLIPSELGTMPRLQNLYVSSNRNLNGTIPSEIGNCQALNTLWLSNNPDLTGPIPSSFGFLTNIQDLFLSRCDLTGFIPSSLGSLTNLRTLALERNIRLTGNIPVELAGLTSLLRLAVGRTALSGEIPEEVCTSLGDALEYDCSVAFCGCGDCTCPA